MSDTNIRNILITGAGKGIGREVARRLATQNTHIFLHYHKSAETARQTANELRSGGCACTLLQADLSRAEHVETMFRELFQEADHIDVLVNNAGILKKGYFISMLEQDWDQIINTNLKSAFLCSKYVAKKMIRQKKGAIINIISTAVDRPLSQQCAYIASKTGLAGLTLAMAKELGPFGIRVNGVSPGPIKTDMNDWSSEQWEKAIATNPLKREITACNVAETVSFLISDAASMLNGEIIRVDGGLYLG